MKLDGWFNAYINFLVINIKQTDGSCRERHRCARQLDRHLAGDSAARVTYSAVLLPNIHSPLSLHPCSGVAYLVCIFLTVSDALIYLIVFSRSIVLRLNLNYRQKIISIKIQTDKTVLTNTSTK